MGTDRVGKFQSREARVCQNWRRTPGLQTACPISAKDPKTGACPCGSISLKADPGEWISRLAVSDAELSFRISSLFSPRARLPTPAAAGREGTAADDGEPHPAPRPLARRAAMPFLCPALFSFPPSNAFGGNCDGAEALPATGHFPACREARTPWSVPGHSLGI